LGAAVTSNTGDVSVSTEELERTLLLGSFRGHDSGTEKNYNESATINATLSADTVTVTRKVGTGAVDFHGQVVKWASGTNFKVYRGTLTQSAATASEDVPIGDTISGTYAIVLNAGSMSSHSSGSFEGAGTSLPDSQCTWELKGAGPTYTDITCKHFANTAADQDISWEVIVWDVSAATPVTRRVMVSG
jgi:hypothetical protein